MKHRNCFLILGIFMLLLFSCRKDPSVPEITTLTVQNLSYFSANCGGLITDDGGAEISLRGICWSTHPNPTISDDTTVNFSQKHHFIAFMQDLAPNTMYFVRAYATNSAGIGYGEAVSFSTLKGSLAEVLTMEPEELYSVMAKVSGLVVSAGELSITERGICWSTEPLPTPHDNKAAVPGGSELFTATVLGLLPETMYYMRAYAINNAGIGYGDQIKLTTPPPESGPVVVTGQIENPNQWVVTVPVAINSSESLPVFERGVCWSTSPEPTIANNIRFSTHNKDTFSIAIAFAHSTTYYLRAYAKTMLTVTYGNQLEFTSFTLGLPCSGHETVSDFDGNVYNTVQIGDLCLMKENLKAVRFSNGDVIPFSASNLQTPAMTYYNQDLQWKHIYGGLYNEAAARSEKGICPEGWRLPFEEEVKEMEDFVKTLAAFESLRPYTTVLMSTRVEPDHHPRWTEGFFTGNDLTGFSAQPAGNLNAGSTGVQGFKYLGSNASWWLADNQRIMRIWNSGGGYIWFYSSNQGWGSSYNYYLSIRCVKE